MLMYLMRTSYHSVKKKCTDWNLLDKYIDIRAITSLVDRPIK